MESLEEDFLALLAAIGQDVDEETKRRVLSAGRTNSSSRSKPTSYYYDEASAELVRRREAVIIEKFGYEFPAAGA